MATITSSGKKRITTNNGRVKLSLNDNRVLHYDGEKYRFLIGDKTPSDSKVEMSKPGENVLDPTT